MLCLGRSFKGFKQKKSEETIQEYAIDHETEKIIVNRELPDIPSVKIILENQLNEDMQLPNNPIPSNLQLYASLSECYSIIKCKKNSVDNQETDNLAKDIIPNKNIQGSSKKQSFSKLFEFIINAFTKRKKMKSQILCDTSAPQQCDNNSPHKGCLTRSNDIISLKLSHSFHCEGGKNLIHNTTVKPIIEPLYSQNVSNKYEVINVTSAAISQTSQPTFYDKSNGPSTSNNFYNKPIYEQGSQIYASLKDDDTNYSIGEPVAEPQNQPKKKGNRHNRISSTGALPAPPPSGRPKSHRRGGSALAITTPHEPPPSPPRFYMTVPPPPPPLPASSQASSGPSIGSRPPPGRRPPLAHSTSVDSGLGGDVVETGGDILTLRQQLDKIKEESYTDVFVRVPLSRLMAPPFLPPPTTLVGGDGPQPQDLDLEGDGQSHQYDYLSVGESLAPPFLASPLTIIPIHTYDKVNYQRLSNSTAVRGCGMDMPTTSHNYFPSEEQVYSVPRNGNQGPKRLNHDLDRSSMPCPNNVYDTSGSIFYDVPYNKNICVAKNQLRHNKERTKSETSFKRILNRRPYSMNEIGDYYCYIPGSSIYSNFYTNRNLMLDNSLYNFYLGLKPRLNKSTQSPLYNHNGPTHSLHYKPYHSYENISSVFVCQGLNGRNIRNHVYQEIYMGRRQN